MRILVLVLSSAGEAAYDGLRDAWRSYMHTHPSIDSFFIEHHPVKEPWLDGDILRLPGEESFQTIRHKTLGAIEYFLQSSSYTHVVRTNLSSFWIFSRLIDRLNACPPTRLFAGIFMGDGISGAGICMTRDVAELLLARRDIVCLPGPGFFEWDDVSFGRALIDVPRTHFGRFDMFDYRMFDMHVAQLPPDYFHIRLKQLDATNRIREGEVMTKLVKLFYA